METVKLAFVGGDGAVKAAAVVEIADTPTTRRLGLSKRAELPPGRGMFFDKVGAYWMKDTWIPLDILFVDRFGTVLEKQAMFPVQEPDPCKPLHIPSFKEAEHAIELPHGWFDAQGLSIGDKVQVVPEASGH